MKLSAPQKKLLEQVKVSAIEFTTESIKQGGAVMQGYELRTMRSLMRAGLLREWRSRYYDYGFVQLTPAGRAALD